MKTSLKRRINSVSLRIQATERDYKFAIYMALQSAEYLRRGNLSKRRFMWAERDLRRYLARVAKLHVELKCQAYLRDWSVYDWRRRHGMPATKPSPVETSSLCREFNTT